MPEQAVTYDAASGRYELALEGGVAYAETHSAGERVVFTHTEVPYALRGSGIGGRLVAGALDDVRRRGLKVVPRCWFVAGFMARNPEYRDLLA